jgi:hypothetical protein
VLIFPVLARFDASRRCLLGLPALRSRALDSAPTAVGTSTGSV